MGKTSRVVTLLLVLIKLICPDYSVTRVSKLLCNLFFFGLSCADTHVLSQALSSISLNSFISTIQKCKSKPLFK